jgi:hypothetical protein
MISWGCGWAAFQKDSKKILFNGPSWNRNDAPAQQRLQLIREVNGSEHCPAMQV